MVTGPTLGVRAPAGWGRAPRLSWNARYSCRRSWGAPSMSDSSAVLPGYPDPLWIQAVALVRGEIERGVLKPGMRLAPERELCQQLGISRVTLRRALGHLVEEGGVRASRA